MALDEGSSGGSRITSQDKKDEDQGLSAPKALTSGGIAHGTELGYDRMGACVCSLRSGQGSCGSLFFSPPGVDTDDTEGRESKPVEGLRGMCRYCRSVGFPLTYTSYKEGPEGYDTRGRCNPR